MAVGGDSFLVPGPISHVTAGMGAHHSDRRISLAGSLACHFAPSRNGPLDQAEAIYKKSLAINKVLGRKEGLANQYGNLGILYDMRGDLDQAEAIYTKALAIDEALGHKQGMAI